MSDDLFADDFDAAEAQVAAEQQHHGVVIKARAIATRINRIALRRAKCEAVLHEILPTYLQMGTSYHVISHGDVDSLSYLIHIMQTADLDRLLISTWCMAMPDVTWIRAKCESFAIGHVDFILGEIFPASYPDEYAAVQQMEKDGLATLKIARNHAKIMTGHHEKTGLHFAIESSSNVNTNPRIEQTAVHMSEELADFYDDFYAGIKTIDGDRYKPKPKATT